MKIIPSFKPGDKVRYIPREGVFYNGIVKSEIRDTNSHVFVVYKWGNNPENYYDYTAARTEKDKLKEGWV